MKFWLEGEIMFLSVKVNIDGSVKKKKLRLR